MLRLLLFTFLGFSSGSPVQRIVGGSNAYEGQFPWQAAIEVRGSTGSFSHTCGGTLIEPNKVLTAAHCVGGSVSSYRVILGRHRRLDTDATEQIFSLTSIKIHPGWDSGAPGFPNDMAVLLLNGNADINNNVRTATMANTGDDFTDELCTISGWGRLQGGGSLPNILQYVSMTQISNNQCGDAFAGVGNAAVLSTHICVQQSGKSACNGDSGGPMVCSGKLAGVTSWVLSGCQTTHPSVYGRVSEFRSWIDSQ